MKLLRCVPRFLRKRIMRWFIKRKYGDPLAPPPFTKQRFLCLEALDTSFCVYSMSEEYYSLRINAN